MAQTQTTVGNGRRPAGDAFDRAHAAMVLVVLAALLPQLVGPSRAGPGLRQDEVQCEEAKAHLIDCCRPFRGYLDCQYRPPGCSSDADFPDLSAGDGKEIRDLSCSEINNLGYCDLRPEGEPSGS
jgi:hypothetical protein